MAFSDDLNNGQDWRTSSTYELSTSSSGFALSSNHHFSTISSVSNSDVISERSSQNRSITEMVRRREEWEVRLRDNERAYNMAREESARLRRGELPSGNKKSFTEALADHKPIEPRRRQEGQGSCREMVTKTRRICPIDENTERIET